LITHISFVCSVSKVSLNVWIQYPVQAGFCKAWPLGKYTGVPGSLLCTDCEAGMWSSESDDFLHFESIYQE
jgi:hypothetical protein